MVHHDGFLNCVFKFEINTFI
jgi:hypothetical protein